MLWGVVEQKVGDALQMGRKEAKEILHWWVKN